MKLLDSYYEMCNKLIADTYDFIDRVKASNDESILASGKRFNPITFDIKDLVIYKNFKNVGYKLKKIAYCAAFALGLHVSLRITGIELNKHDAYVLNKDLIKEYDNNLDEYTKQFDINKMSTMEIVMTVMNDIRSNTYYCEDAKLMDVVGYYRLDLNDENKFGVCRHMADKFTTIMNKIDSRFDAHNVAVLIANTTDFVECNVKKLEDDGTYEYNVLPVFKRKSMKADHMISILKPIGENYYLVVDVTNPSVGVLKNGKIYMFNTQRYNTFEYKPISQFYITLDKDFGTVNLDFLLSCFQNIDLEKLNDEYGLDAQNETLAKIKIK